MSQHEESKSLKKLKHLNYNINIHPCNYTQNRKREFKTHPKTPQRMRIALTAMAIPYTLNSRKHSS